MLLGKRQRPPMKRTTSMTEITFDLNTINAEAPPSSDPHNPFNNYQKQAAAALFGGVWGQQIQANGDGGGVGGSAATVGVAAGGDDNGCGLKGLDQRLLASPRVHRRHSADFMETPHFLRSCGLCRRRLVRGRDIYMYRGDSAFCSLECRQQQMNQDERKEKCLIASKKKAVVTSSAARSSVSAKGETVAAV